MGILHQKILYFLYSTLKGDDNMADNKPVKNGNGKNSPVIGDNGLNLTDGDNSKYLAVSIQLMNLPDIDLKEPQQVIDRLNEYFQIHADNDMKPTVAGMGMALGLDRRRLWEIKTDNYGTQRSLEALPTLTKDSIKKAYKLMENLWENYMQNGKINPVSGIFLGKNNFGYQDKQEHVITPNTHSDSDYSADDIRKRYLSDSDTRLLTDSTTFDSGE
jgi:hypothetical protein